MEVPDSLQVEERGTETVEFIDNNGKDNEVRKRESASAGAERPQAGGGTISQADEKHGIPETGCGRFT